MISLFRQKATAAYPPSSASRRSGRVCAPWRSATRRCQLAGNVSGVACARSWRMISARGASKCLAKAPQRRLRGRIQPQHEPRAIDLGVMGPPR
jgi:hypothetical protein